MGERRWAELPSLVHLLQVSYVLKLESCLHPVLDMIDPDKQVWPETLCMYLPIPSVLPKCLCTDNNEFVCSEALQLKWHTRNTCGPVGKWLASCYQMISRWLRKPRYVVHSLYIKIVCFYLSNNGNTEVNCCSYRYVWSSCVWFCSISDYAYFLLFSFLLPSSSLLLMLSPPLPSPFPASYLPLPPSCGHVTLTITLAGQARRCTGSTPQSTWLLETPHKPSLQWTAAIRGGGD